MVNLGKRAQKKFRPNLKSRKGTGNANARRGEARADVAINTLNTISCKKDRAKKAARE
jgi:hypothetical protein